MASDAIRLVIAPLGLMGFGLSLVGLFGLVSFAAAHRTHEFGISHGALGTVL